MKTREIDLLPYAPTEEELSVAWERYARKDLFVLETLLQILKLVRYPVRSREEKARVGGDAGQHVSNGSCSFSPATSILLSIVFSLPRHAFSPLYLSTIWVFSSSAVL